MGIGGKRESSGLRKYYIKVVGWPRGWEDNISGRGEGAKRGRPNFKEWFRGCMGVEVHACMSCQDRKSGLLISCEIVCYSSIYQKSHVQALWEFAEIQKIYPPTSSTSI